MYSHVVQRSIHINCMPDNHEISILDSDPMLYSLTFTLADNCNLHYLSIYLVSKLIKSPVDSIHGISIVAQQTRFNFVGLNSTRPGVMQINFGKNGEKNHNSTMRFTYGYGVNKASVHDDPKRMITKPFCNVMTTFVNEIHQIICRNRVTLGLQDADLSTPPNVLTFVLYYSIPGIKEKSLFEYHNDTVYSQCHEYLANQNKQRKNTATIVYTLGDERTIRWRRKVHNGKTWSVDKDYLKTMIVKNGIITAINPRDETPSPIDNSIEMVKYQHKVTTKKKCLLGIGLALRVSDTQYAHDNDNFLIDPPIVTPFDPNGLSETMYTEFDRDNFHRSVNDLFNNINL